MAFDIGTMRALQANYQPVDIGQTTKKKRGRGGTATSLISEGGALGGAAAGAAVGSVVPVVGTAIGAIIGAGIGGFGGRLAENKIRDDEFRVNDAAKEGALSAVLAGPLKLAKYGTTAAKTAKGGASLSDALQAGAKSADNFSIRGALAKKTGNAADDLLVKQFRFTPTQLTNFKKKFGEDATTTIKKYGVTNADDITTKAIQPLSQQFDEIVSNLPGVPATTLKQSFIKRYKPLIESAVEDNKSIGSQLKTQANNIFKKYGDVIDAKELNSLRKEFDSLVSYTDKAANPARYGVNKRAADALREALQKSAASQGLPLKEVGRELNKVIQLGDNAAKQSNLGRGSLPIGLSTLLGGTAGGAAFGPAGIGTAAAVSAVNSGTGRRAITKGLQGASNKLQAGAEKSIGLRGALMGASRGALGASGLELLGSPQSSLENSTSNPSANPNSIAPITANMPEQYTQTPETSSPYPRENLIADIQRDPANADKYIEYFQMLDEIYSPKSDIPELTSTQATRAAAAQNALRDIPLIEEAISSGKLGGAKMLPGSKSQLGRRLLKTENLDAALFNIADNILRARSGAAAPEAEVQRFVETFLPAATDSNEAKRLKLDRAVRELQGYVNPSAAAGGNLVVGIEDVLQQYM